MANRLKMANISAILALRERGWSRRRIARELGVHRETVGRYVRLAREGPESAQLIAGSAEAEPAKVIAGSGPPGEPIPAKVLTGSAGPASAISGGTSVARSRCEPFRQTIIEKLEQGLSAQRIHQDLTDEHDFDGSYCSVQRFVRRLKRASPAPFRRMECGPGEEAQIDFGTGAMTTAPDGRRRKTHVFRIVLSHSRKAYSESVYRQTTDEFIKCIENAFHHFGGVPKTLVIDNLKAAVTKADWYDPDINPKLIAFAEHYGTVFLPTKSYTPRHKGKVERGVDYVQENGLKGHTFNSLVDQNQHLINWEQSVADTRIHGTTRKQVGKVFEEVERPALLPLPLERFPHFNEGQRSVHRDGHVEVDKAYYSVPPEYLGHRLWVRWDGRVVRIFDSRMRQIAVHARREPGRFSTQDRHIASRKISNVERGAGWSLHRAKLIGPETGRWAEAMIQNRGIQGVRVLVGLLSLANRHESERIEHACRLAHSHGSYRLRIIRDLIKRNLPATSGGSSGGGGQEQFEFTSEHPIIRSLSDYQRLVTSSFDIVRPRNVDPRNVTARNVGPRNVAAPASVEQRLADSSAPEGGPEAASDKISVYSTDASARIRTNYIRNNDHERHTDDDAEATSPLGDASNAGCPASGGGWQQPEPRRVPGTGVGR